MRYLAEAGDGPAVCVVQGVADLTFHDAARVIREYGIQTVRAAEFYIGRKLDIGFQQAAFRLG